MHGIDGAKNCHNSFPGCSGLRIYETPMHIWVPWYCHSAGQSSTPRWRRSYMLLWETKHTKQGALIPFPELQGNEGLHYWNSYWILTGSNSIYFLCACTPVVWGCCFGRFDSFKICSGHAQKRVLSSKSTNAGTRYWSFKCASARRDMAIQSKSQLHSRA